MATSNAEFVEMCKSMGFSGKELAAVLKDRMAQEAALEQQKLAKEAEIEQQKIAAALEEKKLALEAEREKAKLEAEERREMAKLEAEKDAREAEERMLQMKLDAEDKQRQHDAAVPSQSAQSSHSTSYASKYPKLKLPFFDEKRNDIEEYLLMFEKQAEANDIPKEKRAFVLGCFLTSKAVSVFNNMTVEELKNYEGLKRALLERYGLTESGYCAKYKTMSPTEDYNPRVYLQKIIEALKKWISAANVTMTPDGLIEFFSVDKYLNTVPKELATYLRETKKKRPEEIIISSEGYMEAHHLKFVTNSHARSHNHADKGHYNNNNFRSRGSGYSTNSNHKSSSQHTSRATSNESKIGSGSGDRQNHRRSSSEPRE